MFRVRQRRRGRDVELAAAEAATDDGAFAAERVREDATLLFRAIQAAWSRNDIERLHKFVAPELMAEWELRLKDFKRKGWRNKIEVKTLEVAYVGLVNRAADREDRVVVRISAHVRDIVTRRGGGVVTRTDSDGSEHVDLREWWTLGKRDGKWILLSIEQREEGEHHMGAELVAAPEHDTAHRRRGRHGARRRRPGRGGVHGRRGGRPRLRRQRARRRARPRARRRALRALTCSRPRPGARWPPGSRRSTARTPRSSGCASRRRRRAAAASRGRAHTRVVVRGGRVEAGADHAPGRRVRPRPDVDRGRRARAPLRREPRHGAPSSRARRTRRSSSPSTGHSR